MGPDPIRGLVEATVNGQCVVVEYESDSELRDTEQVPLLDEGGIEGFLRREVLPYASRCLVRSRRVLKLATRSALPATSISHSPCGSREEIRADIMALERENEGVLAEIIG